MGMAASQARYLALVARKSNCEFEGQQINQSRLVLANQSADLFNQMLGLKVPVPPSTQDYTKVQYSYSDGFNSAVIDSWKQLSTSDPDYNYIVNTHYNTKIYTGSLKQLTDPQVQLSSSTSSVASMAQIRAAIVTMQNAETLEKSRYDMLQEQIKLRDRNIANVKRDAANNYSARTISSNIDNVTPFSPLTPPAGFEVAWLLDTTGNKEYSVALFNDPQAMFAAGTHADAVETLDAIQKMLNLGLLDIESMRRQMANVDASYWIDSIDDLTFDPSVGFTATQVQVLNTYAMCSEIDTSTTPSTPTYNRFIVTKDAIDNAYQASTSGSAPLSFAGVQYAEPDPTSATGFGYPLDNYSNDISMYMASVAPYQIAYDTALAAYEAAVAAYEALAQPTYIGNMPVTLLTTLTKEQETELKQVIADMNAQNISTSISNGNYFDAAGNYLGGIYTFKMNGITYYTTYEELCNAYASNNASNNYIDGQFKMAYYNASYVDTRIDKEMRALLETDESGRFKSIRFENDSVTYTLNMETITDDDAYQDAMNQYYYENAKYDKMVQDINAKTSIIQREDQQLELRLKQLDTEQNALKTEIDAVKGIIKDNVDNSFKTFSG